MKTFAAVDMGSNAIRVHICHLLHTPKGHQFKTVEYLRIPLRLGEDVFTTGSISSEKIEKLVLLGQGLMNFFKLYEVTEYLACATSAMREANNSAAVVKEIQDRSGFNIQVIDGETEAEYTQSALNSFISEGACLHIDVGGGSTEINLYQDKVKMASRSFKIGAVRMLMKEEVQKTKAEMLNWVIENAPKGGQFQSIGTGGNIGKIYEMAKIGQHKPISIEQIKDTIAFISGYSVADRINILKLNPDRADVIVPSADIYLSVMEAVEATSMIVPKVGLSDGMLEIMATR